MLGLVLSKTGHEAEGDGSLTKELSFPFVGGQGGGVLELQTPKGDRLAGFLQMCLNHVCATPAFPPPHGGSGGAVLPFLIRGQKNKSDGERRGTLRTLMNLGFPWKPSKAWKARKCQHLDPRVPGPKEN